MEKNCFAVCERTSFGPNVSASLVFVRIYYYKNEKFLQSDWLRAVVFQLNLKYLHVKITNLLRVVL